MKKPFLILIFTQIISLVICQDEDCSAVIQNGTVIGFLTETFNSNKTVCAYMGIPYAKCPVGSLRFKPPEPAASWDTLNATTSPNWCPQSGTPPPGVKISEDCLYLNVYQPKNTSDVNSEGLPVMIWFHGGSFTSGSSDMYTAKRLLARGDVILVVVNYRLGILGFFSTGDHVVPGNNGLKDQAFSIKWVNENIQAFGGNPNKVTIFGESAGGASVAFQLISPLNKGLISGAISQSGNALSTWAIDKNPAESAKIIARRLGCPTLTSWLMLVCLRFLPWQLIILGQSLYTYSSFKNFTYPTAGLTPVVEPNLPGAFISEEPMEIMKKGDVPDIPLLIGDNQHDGSFILGAMYLMKFGPEKLDQNPNYMRHQIVPDLLKFIKVSEDPANRVAASSVELAFLDGVNRSSWNESMPGLVDILTVFAYKSSVQHTADLLVGNNRTVYIYSMEHHSNNSLWYSFFGENANSIPVEHGATHGDELMYIFDLPANFSQQDQQFSDLMCDYWLDFARFGNPTPQTNNQTVQWLPYNLVDEPYMKLKLNPILDNGYRNSWRPSGFD